MEVDAVLAEARAAKAAGATRFCMGAAWRSPKDRDLEAVCAMVEGVQGAGPGTCATLGMLTAAAGAAAEGGRARLLQPQPRHLAGILRRHHHHPHLSGPAGHAGPCARRRHSRVLRRHRRHGRSPRATAAGMIATLATLPAHPESVPINAAGAGRGHAAGRPPGARCARVRAHRRGRPHRHAGLGGAPLGRARGHERRRPRRCASSPAPTRSSTGRSSSPRRTPTRTAISPSSTSSASCRCAEAGGWSGLQAQAGMAAPNDPVSGTSPVTTILG